jgi:hypothetical protein
MHQVLVTSLVLALACVSGAFAPGEERASPFIETSSGVQSNRTVTDTDRNWWAFQPVDDPTVPHADGDNWSQNPIDRFVYHKLAEAGLTPAPQAAKSILVRRLYFDLLGLPPTPEQIDEYVNHTADDAWQRLVDRLLADPRYGEHWARYWLDLVRYAESDGWNQDAYRPHIWRYRDYVVRAFNDDKPYPEFVREQLAGDEIDCSDDEVPENLAATGYLRLGIYEYNQRDARSHWDDVLNEITDVTGDVFLGVGMACAKCHDHKFDPLLQTDYYKLRAFFEPLVWRDDLHYATDDERAAYEEQLAVWKEATREIRGEIDALVKPYNDRKWKTTVDKFPLDIQACFKKAVDERTSWEHQMAYLVERQFEEEGGGPLANLSKEDKEQHEALQKELAEFDSLKPEPLPPIMAATDFSGPVSPTVVPDDPEARPIEPGCLSVVANLAPLDGPDDATWGHSTGRRTALANWIASPDNPLTTRVIVNRIWQHHFGVGLVATSNDFGRMGQRPTHPELLDWLTRQFVASGWSIKHLHRLILTSATWRQSSIHPQASEFQEIDPTESLLWRSRVRRLTAEQIRDAMLAVTSELDDRFGGPSVEVNTPRRSLYVKTFRNAPPEFLCDFDVANGLKSVAERNRTTTPIQALLLINGQFAIERSAKLAARLTEQEFATSRELLTHAFHLTWGRPPTNEELAKSLTFVEVTRDEEPPTIDHERLSDFCHVLLNSNEFLYLD